MASSKLAAVIIISVILLPAPANGEEECASKYEGKCHNKNKALKLKIIAIFCILVTSMLAICLPIFSGDVPALNPDSDLFALVKAFASGVILATGYMHVLPDSFDDLTSPCLPERPWHKFPFTTFVAMLAAAFTLMVDSFSISFFKKNLTATSSEGAGGRELKELELELENLGGHDHHQAHGMRVDAQQLLRHHVVAQVGQIWARIDGVQRRSAEATVGGP